MERLKQIGAVLAAIACVIVFKAAVRFALEDWTVASSRSSGWTAEFRTGFLESCAGEALKSITSTMKINLKNHIEKSAATSVANEYCDCIATDVEQHNILFTEFNRYRGVAAVRDQNEQAIEEYMDSKDGRTAVSVCMEKVTTH